MTDDNLASSETTKHVILFYCYHPLTSDATHIEIFRSALERICSNLKLCGRILVGASKTEGINGTLAGEHASVRAFTWALLGDKVSVSQLNDGSILKESVLNYWKESRRFFDLIGEEELRMKSTDDFKWSLSHESDTLFPDLRIVVRKELIGSGCMGEIPLDETANGYLTPAEWHEKLSGASRDENTVIIDCRNTKEFEIGRFEGAVDPQTTTFSQFPQWVQHNKALLSGKEVLMYCTGGIRCEKASAYIRRTVPNVGQVNHLKGGIHKYLESYGNSRESLWHGKNFVFDGRQAVSAEDSHMGKDGTDGIQNGTVTHSPGSVSEIVGKCVYCESPFDQFDGKCVCAVCREPLLACSQCRTNRIEFHCRQHYHLRSCYFSNLSLFSREELLKQGQQLDIFLTEIAVGKKFKQKRRTLLKQCQRITDRLRELSHGSGTPEPTTTCRNCGQNDCTGKCWGFFGLKRKEILDSRKKEVTTASKAKPSLAEWSDLLHKPKRQRQKANEDPEIQRLGLFQCPSMFRDSETGIRVPPCTMRELKCHTKGKWCGRPIIDVVQEEFKELSQPERLQISLRHGLLRLNGSPLDATTIVQTKLKGSDMLSRILHWHEAPVIVPRKIDVQQVKLPATVAEAYGVDPDDSTVFVCNKPSTVPVHPAGPYFANVLTFLVEAQCGLAAQSLSPVHRTDRVTSGLTLCCTNSLVARVFHKCLSELSVQKMYIAKVKGRFPASLSDLKSPKDGVTWLDACNAVEVNAPVYTSDPANGIRIISFEGKESRSCFKLIDYNAKTDMSVITCFPLTGRNHQLRLHLSWIGHPIVNDLQYGGELESSGTEVHSVALRLMQQNVESSAMHESIVEARKACPVCCDEVGKSFTPAQMLKEGHTIMLHAFRYKVTFLHRKQKGVIASSEYAVGLPDWVEPQLVDRFSWLSS